MFNKIRHNIYSLLRGNQGIAAVEFALSLPLLLALLFGAIEVTRYILITQKIEKASNALSDLVAQSSTMTSSQLSQLITAAGQVMLPYDFQNNGYAVISSVSKSGTAAPVINWQYAGGGNYTQASLIGISNGTATLPAGFTMEDKENVIIAEIFFSYQPLLSGLIYNSSQLYRYSIYKPRLGDLKTLG